MHRRRRIAAAVLAAVLAVVILYALGLAWGYLRLPLAALKSLHDYPIVASAEAVTFAETTDVASSQWWYLEHSLRESPVPAFPRVWVEVK